MELKQMELIGTVKLINDTHVVSEKFKKRDFVLTTEEDTPYPQHVALQMCQDRVNVLDTIRVGNEVKVLFNIRGREWTSPQGEVKYFNTLDAWRIEILNAKTVQQPHKQEQSGREEPPIFTSNAADDDLPF